MTQTVGTYRMWVDVGISVRGDIKRELARNGIPYSEEKGWMRSVITVRTRDPLLAKAVSRFFAKVVDVYDGEF